MQIILVFLAALIIMVWGWRRVYAYNRKKGANALICHLLGCLLSIFPAQFFFYACIVTWTPPDITPAEPKLKLMMWGIFALCTLMLLYLTSRPIKNNQNQVPPVQTPEDNTKTLTSGTDDKQNTSNPSDSTQN